MLIHLWKSAGYNCPALCGQDPGTSALLIPKKPSWQTLRQNRGWCVPGGWPGVKPWDPERASRYHSSARPDLVQVRKSIVWFANVFKSLELERPSLSYLAICYIQ